MSAIHGLKACTHTYEWNMHMDVCMSMVVCIGVYMSIVYMQMSTCECEYTHTFTCVQYIFMCTLMCVKIQHVFTGVKKSDYCSVFTSL